MKANCIADSSVIVKIILLKDKDLFFKLNESFNPMIPANVLEESSFINNQGECKRYVQKMQVL